MDRRGRTSCTTRRSLWLLAGAAATVGCAAIAGLDDEFVVGDVDSGTVSGTTAAETTSSGSAMGGSSTGTAVGGGGGSGATGGTATGTASGTGTGTSTGGAAGTGGGGPIEISVQVAANDRDAWDDGSDGNVDFCSFGDTNWTDAGGYQWSLPIPRGATILSAELEVYSRGHQSSTGAYTARIHVQNVNNAAPFNGAADNIYNRAFSSTTVDWAIPSAGLPANAWSTSPSVAQLVQQVVNRAGWQDDNYLCIAIYGVTANGGCNERIGDYSWDPARAAVLRVTYQP